MIFYEIELKSVPDIRLACIVDIKKYKNKFSYNKDFLELALCTEGRVVYDYSGGETEMVYPGQLMPIFCDTVCKTSAYNNEGQKHITVIVSAKYTHTRYCSDDVTDVSGFEARIKGKENILVPYHYPLESSYSTVSDKLKKIINLNSSDNPCKYIEALSAWFSLTATLTDFVLKKIDKSHIQLYPSAINYSEKAAQYIKNNYNRRLTVSEIADYLGISEGYAQKIFKSIREMSLLEYTNKYRVEMAIQLIVNKKMALNEAAYSVGIDDPMYMSRLFKKVTGLNYRQYLSQVKIVNKI